MELKDSKDTILFTSNDDILNQYEEIFEMLEIEENDFFLEKDAELIEYDIFRFFLTPHGLIAVSSTTQFPEDRADVWNLNTQDPNVKAFLRTLDFMVEECRKYPDPKKLQGAVPYAKGYSYKVFIYNDFEESKEIKRILDERRMGYLMRKSLDSIA